MNPTLVLMMGKYNSPGTRQRRPNTRLLLFTCVKILILENIF